MFATDATNLRKAALALHALSAGDMQRVWQRLDQAQRDALSPLLDELTSLGIPKGRQWIDSTSDELPQAGDAGKGAVQADRSAIWRLRADQALAVLTTQSLDTAVAVMQIAKWPWLSDVVNNWPPEQRNAVRARMDVPRAWPAKLSDQLLQSMAAQLSSMTDVAKPVNAPSQRVSSRRWYHGVMSLFTLS